MDGASSAAPAPAPRRAVHPQYQHDHSGRQQLWRHCAALVDCSAAAECASTAAPLVDLLVGMAGGAFCLSGEGCDSGGLGTVLIMRNDPKEYKDMMTTTLVHPDGTPGRAFFRQSDGPSDDRNGGNQDRATSMPATTATTTTRSMTDLTHKAIDMLFLQRRKRMQEDERDVREQQQAAAGGGGPRGEADEAQTTRRKYHHLNVLCTGMKRRGNAYTRGQALFNSQFGNGVAKARSGALGKPLPTISTFESESWRLLLSRIGEMVMLKLMTLCSIYIALPNGSYMQIAGKPIYAGYWRLKTAMEAQANAKMGGRKLKAQGPVPVGNTEDAVCPPANEIDTGARAHKRRRVDTGGRAVVQEPGEKRTEIDNDCGRCADDDSIPRVSSDENGADACNSKQQQQQQQQQQRKRKRRRSKAAESNAVASVREPSLMERALREANEGALSASRKRRLRRRRLGQTQRDAKATRDAAVPCATAALDGECLPSKHEAIPQIREEPPTGARPPDPRPEGVAHRGNRMPPPSVAKEQKKKEFGGAVGSQLVNRSRIFNNEHFAPAAGLPRKHILMVIHARHRAAFESLMGSMPTAERDGQNQTPRHDAMKRAMRKKHINLLNDMNVLAKQIFPDNALADSASGKGFVSRTVFNRQPTSRNKTMSDGGKRVASIAMPPSGTSALVPHLLDLVRRSSTCDYRKILRTTCPLPDVLLRKRREAKEMANSLDGLAEGVHAAEADATSDPMDIDIITQSMRPRSDSITTSGACKAGADATTTGTDDDTCTASGTTQARGDARSAEGKRDASFCDSLLASYTSHRKVAKFLLRVLLQVLPDVFLSSKRAGTNRILYEKLLFFVRLGRYDTVTAEALAKNIKAGGRDSHPHPTDTRQKGERLTKDDCGSGAGSQSWLRLIDLDREWAARRRRKRLLPSMVRRQRRHLQWTFWLFDALVVPLIRAHFYVTTAEGFGHRVFYYRKPIWAALRRQNIADLGRSLYRKATRREVYKLLGPGSGRRLGFSSIRFVPKRKGMRPLLNGLSKTSKASLVPPKRLGVMSQKMGRNTVEFCGTNKTIQPVLAALDAERRAHPERYAGSVLSSREAYQRLQPFLRKLRTKRHMMARNGDDADAGPGCKDIYIVSCDIERAYDTIPIRKLIEIASSALQQETYVLVNLALTRSRLGGCTVQHITKAILPQHFEGFPNLAREMAVASAPAIYNDKGKYTEVHRETLLSLLKEHLISNLVRDKNDFFVQRNGIPQGSVVSSILCSLHYADMERTLRFGKAAPVGGAGAWKDVSTPTTASASVGRGSIDNESTDAFLRAPIRGAVGAGRSRPKAVGADDGGNDDDDDETLLLRLIDDQLMITTSKQKAIDFVSKMVAGIPEYGVKIAAHKTQSNFDICSGPVTLVRKRLHVDAEGNEFLKWCGLLINARTLDVRNDYTRLVGQHIGSTITWPRGRRGRGRDVYRKLIQYFSARCRPILFDSTVNSKRTIWLNVYQLFLLTAMKFHVFSRDLDRGPAHNVRFFISLCDGLIGKSVALIKRKMTTEVSMQSGRCKTVHDDEMRWLGMKAFHSILSRKQSRYRRLLRHLEARMEHKKYRGTKAILESTASWKKSAVFRCIRF